MKAIFSSYLFVWLTVTKWIKGIDNQRTSVVEWNQAEGVDGGRKRRRRPLGCAAASGPRIIGNYRGISANHVKSVRPLCAPRTATGRNSQVRNSRPTWTQSRQFLLILTPSCFPHPRSRHNGPFDKAKLKFNLFHFVLIMRRVRNRALKTYKTVGEYKCQFFINFNDFNPVCEISQRLFSWQHLQDDPQGTESIRSSSRSSQHRITHRISCSAVLHTTRVEWCELTQSQSPALWACHNFRRAFRLVNLIKIIGACFSVSRLRAERPTSLLRWPCPRDIAQTSSYHYISVAMLI